MIYEVKIIKSGDKHPAARYVEDEQMTIVEAENEEWWKAEDFLEVMKIDRFETDGEEWF